MHDNHETELLSEWDLSQLQDDNQDQDDEEEIYNENSGDLVW